jgi:hypothetical protein
LVFINDMEFLVYLRNSKPYTVVILTYDDRTQFPHSLPLIGSLPSALDLQVLISPPLPCLVTSAPEDGDSMLLRNVGIDLQIYTTPKPKTSTTT